MSDLDQLRIRYEDRSDRDLLLMLLEGQATNRVAIAAIKGDYYGDPERQIKGTKPTVEQHERAYTFLKAILTVLTTLVTVLGFKVFG